MAIQHSVERTTSEPLACWVDRQALKVDLLELKRAAQRQRVLVIDYEALSGARTTRTIRPLSVNFFGPVWLLAAWYEAARDFRCFRLDRIISITTSGATFRDEDGRRLADFKRIKTEEAGGEAPPDLRPQIEAA